MSDLFAALRITLSQERPTDTAHFSLKVAGLARPQDYKCVDLKAVQTQTRDGQDALTVMVADESFQGLLSQPVVPLSQSLLVEMTVTLRELAQVARVQQQRIGHLQRHMTHLAAILDRLNQAV